MPAPPLAAASQPRGQRRRNYFVLLLHGLLGQTGFRLLQAPTFLPTYIHLLTGQEAAVGLARAVQSLGMFLSPILGAGWVERRSRVKGLAIAFGSLMRSQVLCLALLALLAPAGVAAIAIWPVLLLWGLGTGLQLVAFNVLLAKTVPVTVRGRLLGTRNLASGVTLLLVSAAAGALLDRYGFPRGYGWAFLVSFALTALGLAFFAGLAETSDPVALPGRARGRRRQRIPELLRADPGYRAFLVALLLTTAARGVLPFYILQVGADLGLSGSRLAGLTVAYTLAQAGGGLTWGFLGDLTGFRRVFAAALSVWIAGSLIVLQRPSLLGAYAVFVLVGLGFSGSVLAAQTLVLEFGSASDRPLRIATTSSLAEAVGMIGFAGAGLLAQATSPRWVFVVSIALQLAAVGRLLTGAPPGQRPRLREAEPQGPPLASLEPP